MAPNGSIARRPAQRTALLLVALALAGCSQQRVIDSGVQGEVQVGVRMQARAVATAPFKPLSTDLVVRRLGASEEMLTVRSDGNGRFDVPLSPGTYSIRRAGDRAGPHKDVVVQPHRFTHLIIEFESDR